MWKGWLGKVKRNILPQLWASDKHELTRGLPNARLAAPRTEKRYILEDLQYIDFLEEALERPGLKTIWEEFLQDALICFDDSLS